MGPRTGHNSRIAPNDLGAPEAKPWANAGPECSQAAAEEAGQSAGAETRRGLSGGDRQVSHASLRQLLPALQADQTTLFFQANDAVFHRLGNQVADLMVAHPAFRTSKAQHGHRPPPTGHFSSVARDTRFSKARCVASARLIALGRSLPRIDPPIMRIDLAHIGGVFGPAMPASGAPPIQIWLSVTTVRKSPGVWGILMRIIFVQPGRRSISDEIRKQSILTRDVAPVRRNRNIMGRLGMSVRLYCTQFIIEPIRHSCLLSYRDRHGGSPPQNGHAVTRIRAAGSGKLDRCTIPRDRRATLFDALTATRTVS